MSGDAERSQQNGCTTCWSCIHDCYASCTSIIWWMKCLTCNLDCCSGDSENQALLENDIERQQTIITQQPTPSPAGNNVGSEDRTPPRIEKAPEPLRTTTGDDDKLQETTPQRTKSNQVQPQPAATGYEKSSSFEGKIQQIKDAMRRKLPTQKVKVGIFSRSAESENQWLRTKLESASCVKSVRPCYISNNGFREFSENVSSCDFGILYHTQNRGRVNLTDVKDSLYDEELQELSSRLGKKNVIVVIDDLKDSGEGRKKGILEAQPTLGALAADVFLFTVDEKKENIK